MKKAMETAKKTDAPKQAPMKAARVPAAKRISLPLSLLRKVTRLLEQAPSWNLFCHMKLDGDAIGSATALFEAGVLLGKRVRWVVTDPVPPSYLFLPHTGECVIQKKHPFDGTDGLYVFLDSSNEKRGVKGLEGRSPDAVVLNIDHHMDNSLFGNLNCVASDASSTSELMWHIMKAGGWPITPAIAECLYVGMVADTGGFVFSNTTEMTFRAAAELLAREVNTAKVDSFLRQTRSLAGIRLWGLALERIACWGENSQFAMTWLSRKDFQSTGAVESDTEMLVNQMFLIKGVLFAVLIVEGDGEIKVSLRSREGSVAASSVAHALGGGGHLRAAAARISLPLKKAVQTVRETLEKTYAEWVPADR